MKLLFLDIDGCLNSKRTDTVYGSERVLENLDPIAVCLIQSVVEETGCIICLSSDWRLGHDYMELGKQLRLPIMFETNHKTKGLRAEQINEILIMNPVKYAIVDDEEVDGEFDGMNFVKIDGNNGVSYENYLKLIDYLK